MANDGLLTTSSYVVLFLLFYFRYFYIDFDFFDFEECCDLFDLSSGSCFVLRFVVLLLRLIYSVYKLVVSPFLIFWMYCIICYILFSRIILFLRQSLYTLFTVSVILCICYSSMTVFTVPGEAGELFLLDLL